MASRPFIDLDRIDLSQIAFTAEETQEYLRQRGRFAMLDAIVLRDVVENVIVGYKDIRGDDWWAADHIPGRPLFPGVLMIETAAQLCSFDYLMRHEGDKKPFIGFGGVDGTRFRSAVEPDSRMLFVGRMKRVRSGTFFYDAQGFVDGNLVFETQVMGVAM